MGIWGRNHGWDEYTPQYNTLKAGEQAALLEESYSEPTFIEQLQYDTQIRDMTREQMLPGEIDLVWCLEEVCEYFTNIFLLILLIDKFIVKKEHTISYNEVGFVLLLLLKIQFPLISVATTLLSLPHAFKAVKGWLKNNVNKRAELETELRLLEQS